jgi:poly-gamma-glutamate synthesis protein (capsule biosynthesis protein)
MLIFRQDRARSTRRSFLWLSGVVTLGLLTSPSGGQSTVVTSDSRDATPPGRSEPITLFLCGDVMTGRGIDQVLPHPSEPRLCESYVKSAVDYVRLAESVNGPIPKPVDFAYIWGDALAELERMAPDLRIINLETSVTTSDVCAPKGINYRMHPRNVPCLTAAGIDCCVLANNHVLDWGTAGLVETLETLEAVELPTVGAGRTLRQARAPAILDVAGGSRVIVFSYGAVSSGVPRQWAASELDPGVNVLEDLSERTASEIAGDVRQVKRPGDVVVVSIHWGGNWGYEIPRKHRKFAHALIDAGGADLVHGHSSHHPRPIEVYKEKLILYGCGDFLNDYEGIGGYEEFRDDLVLMYFPRLAPATGKLMSLDMTPLQIRKFRLNRATAEDARWLRDTLDRKSAKFGVQVTLKKDGTLALIGE